MRKDNLLLKLFHKITMRKGSQQTKLNEITQPSKLVFEEPYYLQKNREDALAFQDEINNELWLNGQGG